MFMVAPQIADYTLFKIDKSNVWIGRHSTTSWGKKKHNTKAEFDILTRLCVAVYYP